MSIQRLTVRLLLAAALATGLTACSGGLRTEPTTSTLPAGAVAPTLPGASEETTSTTVQGAQSGNAPGTAGPSSTLGGGRTTTTRRAGQTTSTTG